MNRINLLAAAQYRRLVEHETLMRDTKAVVALHPFCVDCGRKLRDDAEAGRCARCSRLSPRRRLEARRAKFTPKSSNPP